MVQVIGAGLPRTGTSSMKAALERLGFGPCHHMFEIFANPDHVDRWLRVGSGADVDWDRVLAGYRSTQDWPASYFWRELAAAYPEAKVVLTVRDPRRWYASFRSLMSNGPARLASETGGGAVHPVLAVTQRLRPLLEGMGRATFGPDWRAGEDTLTEDDAVAAYERHVTAVREGLPADRLLVFDVRGGWGPLCGFLGVDEPADEPFPHLNDSESLKRMFERMAAGGQLSTPFGTVD